MKKVILQELVTLDGLASGPKNSVDFVPASTQADQSFGREQLAFIETIDTLLLGRVTYELFAGYWPSVTKGDEKPFADRFDGARKVVFSRTLDRAPWGDWGEARIVKTSPAREVESLKAQTEKDIGARRWPAALRRGAADSAAAIAYEGVRSGSGALGVRPDPGALLSG